MMMMSTGAKRVGRREIGGGGGGSGAWWNWFGWFYL